MMVWNMFGTRWRQAASGVVMVVLAAGGCARDVHLAGEAIPHVTVGAVTIEGMRLDEKAPPEAVAYAALRAVADDFRAATRDERQAALARQFDVCAPDVIAGANRSTLERDEFVYNVVHRWTPTVSHYVNDFPQGFEEARRRFVVQPVPNEKRIDPEVEETAVAMEVVPPDDDERARVVLVIWLAKDEGFWRVVHFGFEPRRVLRHDADRSSRQALRGS